METKCSCQNPCGPATFVAVNYILCKPSYVPRFEELFSTRAGAIDRVPGFVEMFVLRPDIPNEAYLIVSQWADDSSFKTWVGSPEFYEGHARGFEDLRAAKEAGEEPPMKSTFQTYSVLAR